MILAVSMSHMVFLMLRYGPSNPTLLRVFIINGCYIFSNAFSASIHRHNFAYVVYHLDWFTDIEPSLHPKDESHPIVMYNLYNVSGNPVFYYLVKDFCIYVYQGFGLYFRCSVFVWFWNQGRMLASSSIFCNSLRRIGGNSFLNVW